MQIAVVQEEGGHVEFIQICVVSTVVVMVETMCVLISLWIV